MTDVHTSETRSFNMSRIKSKNTKPEQFICHELFKRGYRYRKNANYIEGHPDLFLRKYNTAIFIHGCFWHRHNTCKYAYMPKSRVEFWQKKFDSNQKRDRYVQNKLQDEGIRCLIVWECTVKKMRKDKSYRDLIINRIEMFLKSDELFAEF